jgi:hypothetical protein
MPFTDKQLAGRMKGLLVEQKVLTTDQLGKLKDKTTENDVRGVVPDLAAVVFGHYWTALGGWMSSHGGDIANTSGNSVPGREGGNPTGLTAKPIYNDAFRDVNQHISTSGFKPVKALSNHLRFISVMGEDDDSDSDSKSNTD